MDVTKPYKFIGFGAMGVTKPYEFIGFGTRIRTSVWPGTGARFVVAASRIGRALTGSRAPARRPGGRKERIVLRIRVGLGDFAISGARIYQTL